MTSLSNLIKKKDHIELNIESFEVEEFQEASHFTRGIGLTGSSLSEEVVSDKLARFEKEAYEKGFEQGQKDGLSLGQKRIEQISKQLESVFNELVNLKRKIYQEGEEELVNLSMAIAKQILG